MAVDDLVGTASARLLAVGATRRDRLRALSLLGVLCDHSDAQGRVRLPLDLLAGEFTVPVDRANKLLQLLLAIEVVAVGEDGIVVAGQEPAATGGLRLAGFLANVAAVTDDRDNDVRTGVLGPAPAGTSTTAPGRRREVVLALVAAAVLVMLPLLAPSYDRAAEFRTIDASPPARIGEAAGGGARSEEAADPALQGPDPAGVAGSMPASGTDEAPSPPGERLPEADSDGGGASGDVGRAGEQTAAPSRSGFGGRPAPAPVAQEGASPSATVPRAPSPTVPPLPVPEPPPAPLVCPAGEPASSVATVTGGSALLGGLPELQPVEVSGTLTNPTDAGVLVESVDVTIGNPVVAVVPALAAPVALGPGETRTWTVAAPVVGLAPEQLTAGAHILRWSWLDAALAASCAS